MEASLVFISQRLSSELVMPEKYFKSPRCFLFDIITLCCNQMNKNI